MSLSNQKVIVTYPKFFFVTVRYSHPLDGNRIVKIHYPNEGLLSFGRSK